MVKLYDPEDNTPPYKISKRELTDIQEALRVLNTTDLKQITQKKQFKEDLIINDTEQKQIISDSMTELIRAWPYPIVSKAHILGTAKLKGTKHGQFLDSIIDGPFEDNFKSEVGASSTLAAVTKIFSTFGVVFSITAMVLTVVNKQKQKQAVQSVVDNIRFENTKGKETTIDSLNKINEL